MILPLAGLVCCALLTCVSTVRASDLAKDQVPDRTAHAEHFVETLAKGEFDTAIQSFDTTMKGALPVAKLEDIWKGLERQAGVFQRRLGSRTSKQGGYNIVFVTCRFERAVLDVKVVFNNSEQIGGLFFLPGKAPSAEAAAKNAPPKGIRETDVTVGSDEWLLPGTLTMPAAEGATPCAAVVLVHGSGPCDRDESVGVNKPFRDLAWGLADKGIAVLRYDKRTKVHAARLSAVYPFTVQDEVIDDALSAVQLLRTTKGIDPARVFVLGHSLGGMLAPRIGQADSTLGGLIIMAGATRKLEDAMVEQMHYLLSLDGQLSAGDESKLAQLHEQADKVKQLQTADSSSRVPILGAPAAYWIDLRNYSPPRTAAQLTLPLLVLQGGRDYQVTTKEFEQWKDALAGKPNATFRLYPKLNHLFIAGEGKPSPAEYDQPGHLDEAVIDEIAGWIQARRP